MPDALVRVVCMKKESGSKAGEYFEVKRDLRESCVISPWLFNIFFGKVVRQTNERVTGRGVKLGHGNGRWCEIKQVLYADDTALVAEIRTYLQHIVNEFRGRVTK